MTDRQSSELPGLVLVRMFQLGPLSFVGVELPGVI